MRRGIINADKLGDNLTDALFNLDGQLRLPALHLVRALNATLRDTFLDHVIPELLGIVTTGDEPVADDETKLVTCAAFSALAVILKYRLPTTSHLTLLKLCLDVLLWKTTWQHVITKTITVSLTPRLPSQRHFTDGAQSF